MQVRNSFLSFLLCFMTLTTFAQNKVTSQAFFEKSISTLVQDNVLSYETIRFPWLEEVQLRTETRDFDFVRQEYTLRLSPSTRAIIKAQQALWAHEQAAPDEQASQADREVVLQLYVDWVSMYVLSEEQKLLADYEKILSDKKTIIEKQLGIGKVDIKGLIDLTTSRNKMKQSAFELGAELDEILSVYDADASALDYSDLISQDEIEKNLATLTIELMSENHTDLELLYDVEGVQKEIALEEAESRQYFDFLQLRYRGPHDDLFAERASIGLGIQWPNSGNRKLKIAQLKLEQQEIEQEYRYESAEMKSRINGAITELHTKLAIAQHFQQLSEEENRELEILSSLVKKKAGYDPLLLFDILEHQVDSRLSMLKYEEDVLLEYIKLLSLSGRLAQSPFVNYLRV